MSSFSRLNSPTNVEPIETAQLKELRARLVDAQAAEIAASNALIDFDGAQGHSEGASFSSLMADARATRDRTMTAYEEWSRAVEAFNNTPSRIVEQEPPAADESQEGSLLCPTQ